jgi:FKBP-type peptidyl-prolyl cis-trans isomerase SlyD
MSFEENKVVTINYTVKDKEGNVLDSTTKEHPYAFLSGQNQILPELENQLGQMLIGSKKQIVLTPEQGYGEYDEKAVRQVNRSDFPENVELKEGMRFVADTGDGRQLPFIITNIEENDIKIDFNHPYAGKTLEFDVELIDVREASDEELTHGHAHGPDGHHHHH